MIDRRAPEARTMTDTNSSFEMRDSGGYIVESDQLDLCPELLTIRDLGSAYNWRGRAIRAFFQIMRIWRT